MTLNKTLQEINDLFPETGSKLPALFIGHGNPMNAIEENEFSLAWSAEGKSLARPNAILCISAHWETLGTHVTAMEKPKTIYDFFGFPRALYEAQYPAPGSPALAELTQETVKMTPVGLDQKWGLDHGAWSVLCRMFPKADIPVIQFSLDRSQPPEYHYALGKELHKLRSRGVLIIGSGNMVHNIRLAFFQDQAYDWAIEYDETLKNLILAGDHEAIVHYERLGKPAALSIPTNEHYLPLLYTLALIEPHEPLHFFADRVTLGSISMRSLRIG